MPLRRRLIAVVVGVVLAGGVGGAMAFRAHLDGLRTRGHIPDEEAGRDCPLPSLAHGTSRPSAAPWRSINELEADLSLTLPCSADAECTVYGIETGCCQSESIPVLVTRHRDLVNALGSCRSSKANCMQKCGPSRLVPACSLGRCVLRERSEEELAHLRQPRLPPPGPGVD